jgi:hypothetical protein
MKSLFAIVSLFAIMVAFSVDFEVNEPFFAAEQTVLEVEDFEATTLFTFGEMEIPAASITILDGSDVLSQNVTARSTLKRRCAQEANSYG